MPVMAIPENLRPTWDRLYAEVFRLYAECDVYLQIYRHSERRIALLNEASGDVFGFVQRMILDKVQLTLAKLNDPSETKRHKNLTLNTLVDGLRQVKHPMSHSFI